MSHDVVACQCHVCSSTFERNRSELTRGDSFCPSCVAPLSVLNIVPLWDENENLTIQGDDARN